MVGKRRGSPRRRDRTSPAPGDRPPSMERVLSDPAAAPLIRRWGREPVKSAVREAARLGARGVPDLLERSAAALVSAFAPEAPRVVNATGVLIHTNLGRAPLSERARGAASAAAEGYHALEIDLDSGKRGSRGARTRALAARLLGAED